MGLGLGARSGVPQEGKQGTAGALGGAMWPQVRGESPGEDELGFCKHRWQLTEP